MAIEKQQGNSEHEPVPEYLKRWPGLYVRQDDRIVEALPKDIQVAQGYPTVSSKGSVLGGRRITIMCSKETYRVDEQVRVIHVLEVLEPGRKVFVMGPKQVYGEYIDGKLVTEPSPDWRDPLVPELYDGTVLSSPAVDYNYDITSYAFTEPGARQICWKLGDLESNTLVIQVIDD